MPMPIPLGFDLTRCCDPMSSAAVAAACEMALSWAALDMGLVEAAVEAAEADAVTLALATMRNLSRCTRSRT